MIESISTAAAIVRTTGIYSAVFFFFFFCRSHLVNVHSSEVFEAERDEFIDLAVEMIHGFSGVR